MKLRVFTPTEVVFEEEVAHVTVEDPTGLPGIPAGCFA
jgi:F0F1-type ATP synthase epsilon subunit